MKTLPILRLVVLLMALGTPALGHGSMFSPVSRVYRIFLENPETPKSPSSTAALAVGGTQPFYDWSEVNRLVPDYNYQALIPDGQLASAGRSKYAGLDLVRSDWPATSVNPGPFHMVFAAHVPHDPSFFKAYISRPDWKPTQPLRWADLVPLDGAQNARKEGNTYVFDTVFPARTGKHVIYVIWQRIDPAGEAFFSLSDVDFGDGTGYGNPGGTTPPPLPSPTPVVECREDSRWDTGFVSTIRLTNPGTNTINLWTLSFQLNGTIVNFWDAVSRGFSGGTFNFGNAYWNGQIAPGATVTFGFQAAAGRGVKLTGFAVNGKPTDPVCGPTFPPPDTTPVTGTLKVKATSNWGTGFTGEATLKNTSTRNLSGWTVTFDFPHRITTLWDAELVSRDGNRYTIRNAAWNSSLKAGTSVKFGFNAEPGGTIKQPTNLTLK
ncbi:MAG TPA: cellulose binding domain-containing protein [Verrucomicrobiota bacterium]|nr:cellulose binding domain-containing protein [Verrucomicrobiota bacterium]